MLILKEKIPQDDGFYFMSYYPTSTISIGMSEITLKQLKCTSADVVIVDDDETLSGYPNAWFSDKTPEYVTKEFANLVNSYIAGQNFYVTIGMVVNESLCFDDSFAVFVRSNTQPEITIITQYTDGRVEQTFVRGNAAIKMLADFL